MSADFQPAHSKLLFTKHDKLDPRLGEMVLPQNLQGTNLPYQVAILGYCNDLGVKLNGGRAGSALAPDLIRKALYKMTPNSALRIYDAGNLVGTAKLSELHALVEQTALKLYPQSRLVMSFGGGHDFAFPDISAFLQHHKNSFVKPLIINFDAHLDCRPVQEGISNSGTPFRQLLERFPQQFNFLEVGLQPQCNSPAHLTWAKSQGAQCLFMQEINSIGLLPLLKSHLHWLPENTPVFISFDIDSLGGHAALGASQSFYTGLKLEEVLTCLNYINTQFQVGGMGIYEVNPAIDFDEQTAKNAALLAFHQIFQG